MRMHRRLLLAITNTKLFSNLFGSLWAQSGSGSELLKRPMSVGMCEYVCLDACAGVSLDRFCADPR